MQLETPLGRRRALLRQEFRGLTVLADSGTLLARPLHKFWHVGQRPELRSAEERWLLQARPPASALLVVSFLICTSLCTSPSGQRRARLTLLENLDGVMIHFWMLEGVLPRAGEESLDSVGEELLVPNIPRVRSLINSWAKRKPFEEEVLKAARERLAAVVARKVHASRARELRAKLLADVADRRRVDERRQLLGRV